MATQPQSTSQAPVKQFTEKTLQDEYLPGIMRGREGKEATKRKATQGKAHGNAHKSRP